MPMNRRSVFVILLVLALAVAATIGLKRGKQPDGPAGEASNGKPVAGVVAYTCPMHPFILKNTPGTCPICAMDLVRKVEGVNLDRDLKGKQHVSLSPTQQVLSNLATTVVVVKPFTRVISCTGSVAYNQDRQAKVAAWVGGRLDRLLVKSVGSQVRKDRPVAELFSVDLYNAQVQYLISYKTIKILNNSVSVPFPVNTQMVMGEAYERLRQLGFREEQFDRLQETDVPNVRVPLYSPLSGVVTETFVREGQYVNVGEQLFAVADLSLIWVELEVFESDLPLVKAGQDVTILSQAYPGDVFQGKVKLIYPFLDPKTRTVKLRVEIPNPGLKLKPEMYVQGTINVRLADSLVVPVGAVMDTGSRQAVWVESSPGVFQPRNVKTGAHSGTEVQILSGLTAGEKVAVSGGYLIDSEAQLSRGGAAPASDNGMEMKDVKMP